MNLPEANQHHVAHYQVSTSTQYIRGRTELWKVNNLNQMVSLIFSHELNELKGKQRIRRSISYIHPSRLSSHFSLEIGIHDTCNQLKNMGINQKPQKRTSTSIRPEFDINSINAVLMSTYITRGCSEFTLVVGGKTLQWTNSCANECKKDKIISRHNSICMWYDVQIVGAF